MTCCRSSFNVPYQGQGLEYDESMKASGGPREPSWLSGFEGRGIGTGIILE